MVLMLKNPGVASNLCHFHGRTPQYHCATNPMPVVCGLPKLTVPVQISSEILKFLFSY